MDITGEKRRDIGDAVNMIHAAYSRGMLNDDGSPPDFFVKNFIELCEMKYKDGLTIACESFAQYDRDRLTKHKWSGIRDKPYRSEKSSLFMPVSKDEGAIKDSDRVFSVDLGTKSHKFAKLIYNFVSIKKQII